MFTACLEGYRKSLGEMKRKAGGVFHWPGRRMAEVLSPFVTSQEDDMIIFNCWFFWDYEREVVALSLT